VLIKLMLWPAVILNLSAASLSDIKTVFVIVMENHSWSYIKSDPDCPFINNSLLPNASVSPMFFSPTGVHPSEPNYIWMEAGQGFGIYDDNPHLIDSTNHLTTRLDAAGISWRSYQESMVPDVYPIADHYPFFTRHCPQLHFLDVVSDQAYCMAHIRPYDDFAADLENNKIGRYNFITPNTTNDMHDFVPGFPSARAAGDYWLSHEVPKILASEAFRDNGALFITWDEGTGFADGPFGMIVLSPLAKGNGYASQIRYTHSSTLRTMQTIFGLHPFLGDAENAQDLGDLFSLFKMNAALSSDLTRFVITLEGLKPGQNVRIDRSPDLISWSGWKTETAVSNSIVVVSEGFGFSREFFRASLQP
jgi:hypothetical protein